MLPRAGRAPPGHQSRLVGHGRTAGIDRPIDIHLMGDNIATLVDHLQLK